MPSLRARFAMVCAAWCILPSLLCAAPALTTIQDVLYKADGSRFNGLLQITWTSFQAADTSNIATQNVSAQVSNGYLHVLLVPTTNATTPAVYTVTYNSDGAIQFTETWVVPPSTSPLRVSDVRSLRATTPTGSLAQVQIADVSGLRTELNIRPTMGAAFAPSRAAVIDSGGGLASATGNLADCVRVDGTSGPCGGSGGTGGTSSSVLFSDGEVPSGAIDGVNTAFQLANSPNPSGSLTLFRNGLALRKDIEFTVSGQAITFLAGNVPQPGDMLQAFYRTALSGGSNGNGGSGGSGGDTSGNATQLQGRNVSANSPADGQVLGWVSANGNWEPVNSNAAALTNASAQANRPWFCRSTNGTSSYACALAAAALTTYTAGMCLDLLVDTTNTGSATLNVDGLGSRNIKQADGSTDPAAGMIVGGRQVRTCYDGNAWRLPPSNTPVQNGMVAWNGAYVNRSIVGTSGVRCVNGDGTAGNPTCSADTAIVQAQNYASDTGVGDAYTVALPIAPPALADGLLVAFKAAHSNTGSVPTIAVNGFAAKAIKKHAGMPLATGDIAANGIYELRYESACDCFQMQSLPGNAAAISGFTLQDNAGSTVGTRSILQILNGTYLTCTVNDTGTKLTQQCEPNTAKLVDRTMANTWTAGARQTFQASASTEGLNLAPAALPAVASAGALAILNTDNSLNIFDGGTWNKALTATAGLTNGVPLVGLGGNKVGLATTTGTGNIVFSSSPALNLPVIGDFSSATHNHTNAANGGTLPAGAIVANFTGTCDSTHALFGDGSCKTAGAGTVTSFAVASLPAWLMSSVSNPTTTPSLAISASGGQTSHQVIGTCGTSTSFGPCSLAAVDIPAALASTTSVNGTSIPASATLMTASSAVAKGQTPLTTKGDLWVTDGTNMHRLGVGSDGQVLTADAASSDGVKWAAAAAGAAWTKYTVAYSSLTNASATQDIVLFNLASNSVISGIKIKHSAAFTATGLTAMTVQLQGAGVSGVYSDLFDVFQAPANTALYTDGGAGELSAAAHDVVAHFVSTGANLSTLSAGSVDIWIKKEALP